MVDNKSLDVYIKIIAAMLRDANASHGVVFNTRALRLTTEKVAKRLGREGLGFLTKTLPRLSKCFDQALAGEDCFSCDLIRMKPFQNTKLPRFLGEFWVTIFTPDGEVLPDPDANSVRIVRQLLACFYKLKMPHTDKQEHEVIQAFKSAEDDLKEITPFLEEIQGLGSDVDNIYTRKRKRRSPELEFYRDSEGNLIRPIVDIIHGAKRALRRVLLTFDVRDITPRHGPGVVATGQKHSGKFRWVNVSKRITDLYPFDEYFCSSLGHVCDIYRDFNRVGTKDLSAKVILVPKDSRGPRLISCEPVDFQWIQQGISKALVRHVESHYLTKGFVNFTDQNVNRNLALKGSITGDYVTLDLKEASDRVHTDLVRLLFPDSVFPFLEASRSLSTVLPTGEEVELRKYAPMGSALCFPILALTIWSLLTGAAPNAYIRKNIFVYGDDVIVPKEFSSCAMATLELFGLKINRSKSCCSGFFRESCGMDAFKGVDVTPVRFRTVWDKSPRPDAYSSYIAYANAFYDRGWVHTYKEICSQLHSIYGDIPADDMSLTCPSLRTQTVPLPYFPSRWNKRLQKREFLVRDLKSISHEEYNVCGWQKLLRFFTESEASQSTDVKPIMSILDAVSSISARTGIIVSQYTKRRASKLVRRWR